MAFQVIFSTYQVPSGVISSFDAGDNQVAICASSVVLTATVIGDLTGHTVEWEQVSGSPVTFITPLNQLVVQFTMVTSPDRLFRFWIDRYTPDAMFDDVWVFGTPITEYNNIFSGQPPTLIGEECRTVSCVDFSVVASTPLLPHDGVSSCDGDTNFQLIWNPPSCDNDKILFYIVESNDGAGWTQHAIITNIEQRFLSVPAMLWYRVVTVFNDSIGAQQILSYTISCQKHTPSTGAAPYVWDSSSAVLVGNDPTITYAVTLLTLKIKDDLLSDADTGIYATAGVSDLFATTYNVIVRTLKIKDDPEIASEYYNTLYPIDVHVIGYDVLARDGSVIGG